MPAAVMSSFCGFLSVMEEAVLPAVSLLPANCCVAEEVWNYLKMLDYTYRY
jgi:THO complex subunit 2